MQREWNTGFDVSIWPQVGLNPIDDSAIELRDAREEIRSLTVMVESMLRQGRGEGWPQESLVVGEGEAASVLPDPKINLEEQADDKGMMLI